MGAAACLLGIAFAAALSIALAGQPGSRFGGDWMDYRAASQRLAAGQSPYAADMLATPVPAQGADRYRYPPLLAQLVLPVAVLPETVGLLAWSAILMASLFLGTWIAVSAAGIGPSPAALAWTAAGTLWFMPTLATVWTGNASATLAVATGAALFVGARPGVTDRAAVADAVVFAIAAVGRLSPFALIPAMLRRGGRVWMASLMAVAGLIGASLLLAPFAWRDYATVLPNILKGDTQYANNLAPDVVAVGLGATPAVAALMRGIGLLIAVLLLVVSYRLAARDAAWPAAVSAAVVAALLIPPVLWYHYLTALLPLAAFAWLRGGRQARILVAASVGLVDVGLAVPALGAIGAGSLATSVLATLWPRPQSHVRPSPA